MFAVVRFIEKERSLKGFFTKLKVKSERINLTSGGCFFIITAEKRKNKVPLDKIIHIAGNLRNSLIFPSDFTGNGNIKPYAPSALRERLLFEFAVKCIGESELVPCQCSVCIEDNSGIYTEVLHRLLPIAARIQVVCSDTDIYRSVAERIFYEYGCSLILSEGFDSFSLKCDAIISYNGDEKPFISGKCVYSKNIYTGLGIGLAQEYDTLCPVGVDKEIFASALYERCNVPAEIFFLDNIPRGDIY